MELKEETDEGAVSLIELHRNLNIGIKSLIGSNIKDFHIGGLLEGIMTI